MLTYNLCFHITALCRPDCDRNHTCIAPDTCVCPTGWTGNDCHIGTCMMILSSRYIVLLSILSCISLPTDINECEQNNAGCEQDCTNFDGGYNCSCRSRYALATDLHNCLGKPFDLHVMSSQSWWGFLNSTWKRKTAMLTLSSALEQFDAIAHSCRLST